MVKLFFLLAFSFLILAGILAFAREWWGALLFAGGAYALLLAGIDLGALKQQTENLERQVGRLESDLADLREHVQTQNDAAVYGPGPDPEFDEDDS